MQGEIVFIINPISGKRNKGSIRKEIVDALIKERGLKARSVLTEEAKHATDIARQASKYRLTLDDGCVSIDALVLAIANSSQYGSNTYIAPLRFTQGRQAECSRYSITGIFSNDRPILVHLFQGYIRKPQSESLLLGTYQHQIEQAGIFSCRWRDF